MTFKYKYISKFTDFQFGKSICIAFKFTVSLCCNYSFVSRLVQRFLFEEQNCLGKKIFDL